MTIKTKGLLVWLLLSLCFLVACSGYAAETEKAKTVPVPLSRLIELKSLMESQDKKISLLEKQLTAPTTALKEQQSLISELRTDLQKSQSSLKESELTIAKQEESLMSLSADIRQKQRQQEKIKRQRTFWQILAGGAIVALIKAKHV